MPSPNIDILRIVTKTSRGVHPFERCKCFFDQTRGHFVRMIQGVSTVPPAHFQNKLTQYRPGHWCLFHFCVFTLCLYERHQNKTEKTTLATRSLKYDCLKWLKQFRSAMWITINSCDVLPFAIFFLNIPFVWTLEEEAKKKVRSLASLSRAR